MFTLDQLWLEYSSQTFKLPPICQICGSHFVGTLMDYAPLNVKEMEADYFLTCAGWRTLYYLILYDPHTHRYRVSGVAQHALVSPWAHVEYLAPWDADD